MLLLQKEEEVRSMQTELHSVLAGVTAARHEQQEEQRKIAQLKHQHEDTLQVPLLQFCQTSASMCYSVAWCCIVLVSSMTSALAE